MHQLKEMTRSQLTAAINERIAFMDQQWNKMPHTEAFLTYLVEHVHDVEQEMLYRKSWDQNAVKMTLKRKYRN